MNDTSSSLGITLVVASASVLLLFCLIVLCASHWCNKSEDVGINLVDLRSFQLREDLVDTTLDAGCSEWQCIVCAHMNHPNHETCLLCGTSVDFSMMEETIEDPSTHKKTRMARTTFLGTDNHTLLSSTLLENLTTSFNLTTESNGDNESRKGLDTLHKANTLPILLSDSSFEDSTEEIEATTSMRQRALRYRRLNEMELNQKQRGASRRRLWQRVPLSNGGFVWVRAMDTSTETTDSFIYKLRNASFLRKNSGSKQLHGTLAEQLHRKNAASMGFFTELNATGTAVSWHKMDSIALDIVDKNEPSGTRALDFEGILAMTWREKKRWFLKQLTLLAVPFTVSVLKLDVRRSAIFEDSVPQLAGPDVELSRMHEHLNITFINEPALDAGGVLREWFGLICQDIFSAKRGLFVTTHAEDSSYWINSESLKCVQEDQNHLQLFTFAGRLLGKAILDGLVLEVSLSLPLLKHLLGVPITFSDLEYLDQELFKHLCWVRDHDNVEDLCVTFSLQTPSGETVELKPDGENVDVTDENKMEYLMLVLRYRMLDSVSEQLTALLRGLYDVIPKALLTIFDYQELDFYLTGLPTLDVIDWQNNCRIRHATLDSESDEMEREIEVIEWFWDVVGSFTDEQRARLLQFATGSSRVPVEGFRALTSASGIVNPFTLQMVPLGTPPLGLCPRAHTCFNRIDLPIYESKEDLYTYLSLVIQMEITGFGFE
ncbi:hect e3 ubiquitin [Plasmopara halstedii]|uniref:HECT-type E3 ubiquitin transferase n=1 Tax=Plasmopara halstedii TaxID=4781 RepID=A0A0P1A794_PLAHL|nr:hect e3 ubiquitin [Plasmopara halstedii]CEG36049.1 hect e3 ubiquitin [Plasmopara halstedii]|eukprot:XP_024572418.1 hect e3 ubiquitin [Plasmopara halstedii]